MVRQEREVSKNYPGSNKWKWEVGKFLLKEVGKHSYKYYTNKQKPAPSGPKRKGSRSFIRPDGTSTGQHRVARRRKRFKRKPRSLKQRVISLEKNKPKISYKNWAENEFFKVPNTGTTNAARMFQIQCVTAGFVDGAIASLSGTAAIDFTAENTAVQVKNSYSKVLLKNAQTGNIRAKYMFVKCTDNTNDGYQVQWRNAYQDRYGVAVTNILSPVAPATATTSIYPERQIITYPEGQAGMGLGFGYLEANSWKPVSQQYSLVLGPGDSVVATHTEKMFTYRPEDRDVAGTTYLEGDICLIAFIEGTLSHDAVNKDKVGLGKHALDVERALRFQVRYSDGKGLRQHTINAAVSETGFNTPSHADNHTSAIETDAQ